MEQQIEKAVEKQPKSIEIFHDIKDWIKWNISPIVMLSIMALLISIASATLSISRLIQYLISH